MKLDPRRLAGIAVLLLLAGIAIALIPPYYHNLEFQRYLDDAVERPLAPEAFQAVVVDKAAQMGLPVRTGDVQVRRKGNGIQVDIIYVVRVDFPLYTVDLHFHPSASTE